MDYMLSLTILWRGVSARKAQHVDTCCMEHIGGKIDELLTVVCLQKLHRLTKLCASISN